MAASLSLSVLMLFPVSESRAENGATIQALKIASQGRWQDARDSLSASRDPLSAKIYTWLVCTRDDPACNFNSLMYFINQNPSWPGMDRLLQEAEQKMPNDIGLGDGIAWYENHPPQTAAGLDIYMRALLASGRAEQAREFITDWWSRTLVSRDEQKNIYTRYGNYIDMQAHRRRFDMLLFAEQYTNARAMAGVLGAGYPELAEARIALAENSPGVSGAIAQVPSFLQKDPGLLYERLHWRRVNNMDAEAINILYDAPAASQIQNPGGWWKERHILIRRMLEKQYYRNAYLLASKHGMKDGPDYAEAEWLAGWLALEFIDNPQVAYRHFENMYQKVNSPISKSRGAYWAGRAAAKFASPDIATQWFEEAAKYQTVFYGQLAGSELGLQNALPHAAPPVLTGGDLAHFNGSELVRASQIFYAAGMRKEGFRFLKAFLAADPTPKAYRFSAELAAHLGQSPDALQIAKDATSKGMFLTAQSYPVITQRLKASDPEWALVHAIIRQESMFDERACSPAGALGLMQLMPGTAKHIADRANISFQSQYLTDRPDYNVQIGSLYLDSLLSRYQDSYPLAIAAYNAGPGNVDKWLVTFGDPRTSQIDLIDWIELIPFSETRNYVQRVMEGVYVYRLRLLGKQKPPVSAIHVVAGNP